MIKKKPFLVITPAYPPPMIGGSIVYIYSLLENSYLNNPKVECLPGFEEADVYFNIVTKSSLLTKYGDYWCTVGRVCCK